MQEILQRSQTTGRLASETMEESVTELIFLQVPVVIV